MLDFGKTVSKVTSTRTHILKFSPWMLYLSVIASIPQNIAHSQYLVILIEKLFYCMAKMFRRTAQ